MKNNNTSGSQAASPTTPDRAESDGYLTPIELAAKLKVSTRTVSRYRSCGMPARGRGNFVRYYLPEVEQWLDKYLAGLRQRHRS
jgi:hypothetical protein